MAARTLYARPARICRLGRLEPARELLPEVGKLRPDDDRAVTLPRVPGKVVLVIRLRHMKWRVFKHFGNDRRIEHSLLVQGRDTAVRGCTLAFILRDDH